MTDLREKYVVSGGQYLYICIIIGIDEPHLLLIVGKRKASTIKDTTRRITNFDPFPQCLRGPVSEDPLPSYILQCLENTCSSSTKNERKTKKKIHDIPFF